MPCGTLGKAKISRLLLGGNLISGCMHCRDLKYVGSLFRAYATEQKIIETYQIDQHEGPRIAVVGMPDSSKGVALVLAGTV